MSVLIKPLVTEKVVALNERGRYGFIVKKTANKVQIKKEVEKAYGVTVESVNTMIHPSGTKRKYTKSKVVEGRTSMYKKAIVQVADGDIIDFYSDI